MFLGTTKNSMVRTDAMLICKKITMAPSRKLTGINLCYYAGGYLSWQTPEHDISAFSTFHSRFTHFCHPFATIIPLFLCFMIINLREGPHSHSVT